MQPHFNTAGEGSWISLFNYSVYSFFTEKNPQNLYFCMIIDIVSGFLI